ncbi:hypothetical protein HMI55_005501, partial [Coelomomyces lativittatus]
SIQNEQIIPKQNILPPTYGESVPKEEAKIGNSGYQGRNSIQKEEKIIPKPNIPPPTYGGGVSNEGTSTVDGGYPGRN